MNPAGWHDWYDWALVYRYWMRNADGLRSPYRREQQALLRLGAQAGMTVQELADHLGVAKMTVVRWRQASL